MAKKLPKPYKEADGWAFRLRRGDQDIYRSGYKTQAAAREALTQLAVELAGSDKPVLMGPFKTSVGVGLCDYALERLPYLKGARQEANRINAYLRALGLPVIRLSKPVAVIAPVKQSMRDDEEAPTVHFTVSFVEETERAIPAGLSEHRARLKAEGAASDALRAKIARTAMAEVSGPDLQAFVNQMKHEGFGASSIHLEVAVLRQLFNHARKAWRWVRPVVNPALGLDLPALGNGRDRVLTEAEWTMLSVALARYDNPYVLPLVSLMLESAMRSCEPLTLLEWRHIDWDFGVLRLPDGKTGKRVVPLSLDALRILRYMQGKAPKAEPDSLVFATTYVAVNKAWRVACKDAGISGIRPHDVRHTSATRYALEMNGNVPVLKVITGHKTTAMVERYVNLTGEQVARLMRGEELTDEMKPAGFGGSVWDKALGALDTAKPCIEERHARRSDAAKQWRAKKRLTEAVDAGVSNVVVVDFARRAAA